MRFRALAAGAALAAAALATTARAVQPDEILPDARLEKRARTLSAELRCLVCQNQSVDDSDAPLARDLRLLVRERLVKGDSDDAVLRFLVARYGDFVLLRPPLTTGTLLLWLGPTAMVAAAGTGLALAIRRRRETPEAMSDGDRAIVEQLLADPTYAAARSDAGTSPTIAPMASAETGRDRR